MGKKIVKSRKNKEVDIIMRKLFKLVQKKSNVVTLFNLCALAVAISTMNTTCAWVHHQPEVPEEAKRFRKF